MELGTSLRVVGAGIGRTGTRSLKEALEQMGFGPCYHMHEVFDHPEHAPFWLAAAAGETVNWNDVFAGYQATTDEPGCIFYAELMERYPNARVILSVRDPEAWYQSCMNTIYPASAAGAGSEFGTSDDPVARVINTLVWQKQFEGAFLDKQRAIDIFNRHNQEVVERVPPERLLVHEVTQGWEPLCRFLGVAVPTDMPFPHLNTTEEWQKEREAPARR